MKAFLLVAEPGCWERQTSSDERSALETGFSLLICPQNYVSLLSKNRHLVVPSGNGSRRKPRFSTKFWADKIQSLKRSCRRAKTPRSVDRALEHAAQGTKKCRLQQGWSSGDRKRPSGIHPSGGILNTSLQTAHIYLLLTVCISRYTYIKTKTVYAQNTLLEKDSVKDWKIFVVINFF